MRLLSDDMLIGQVLKINQKTLKGANNMFQFSFSDQLCKNAELALQNDSALQNVDKDNQFENACNNFDADAIKNVNEQLSNNHQQQMEIMHNQILQNLSH